MPVAGVTATSGPRVAATFCRRPRSSKRTASDHGSRNRRAYRLAFRLWAQGCDEHEVAGTLKRCWDATPNQGGSSWQEIWRTALSARRRHDDAMTTELVPYRPFIDNFLGA